MKNNEKADADAGRSKLFKGEKVRDVVQCTNCHNPRFSTACGLWAAGIKVSQRMSRRRGCINQFRGDGEEGNVKEEASVGLSGITSAGVSAGYSSTNIAEQSMKTHFITSSSYKSYMAFYRSQLICP